MKLIAAVVICLLTVSGRAYSDTNFNEIFENRLTLLQCDDSAELTTSDLPPHPGRRPSVTSNFETWKRTFQLDFAAFEKQQHEEAELQAFDEKVKAYSLARRTRSAERTRIENDWLNEWNLKPERPLDVTLVSLAERIKARGGELLREAKNNLQVACRREKLLAEKGRLLRLSDELRAAKHVAIESLKSRRTHTSRMSEAVRRDQEELDNVLANSIEAIQQASSIDEVITQGERGRLGLVRVQKRVRQILVDKTQKGSKDPEVRADARSAVYNFLSLLADSQTSAKGIDARALAAFLSTHPTALGFIERENDFFKRSFEWLHEQGKSVTRRNWDNGLKQRAVNDFAVLEAEIAAPDEKRVIEQLEYLRKALAKINRSQIFEGLVDTSQLKTVSFLSREKIIEDALRFEELKVTILGSAISLEKMNPGDAEVRGAFKRRRQARLSYLSYLAHFYPETFSSEELAEFIRLQNEIWAASRLPGDVLMPSRLSFSNLSISPSNSAAGWFRFFQSLNPIWSYDRGAQLIALIDDAQKFDADGASLVKALGFDESVKADYAETEIVSASLTGSQEPPGYLLVSP